MDASMESVEVDKRTVDEMIDELETEFSNAVPILKDVMVDPSEYCTNAFTCTGTCPCSL